VKSSDNSAGIGVVAKRAEILECLRNGMTDKREMEGNLDVSRSTINRALAELQEERVIETRNCDYELTIFGELSFREYSRFSDVYDVLIEAKELLDHLPKDAEISTELLRDADVQLAEQPAPDVPLKTLQDHIRRANQVDILTPILVQRLVDLLERRMAEHQLNVTLVCSTDLLSYLSEEYPDWIETMLENCGIWKTERTPEYGLYLIDETELCLCIYDENGKLQGTISNTTQSAVDWAIELIEDSRHRGEKHNLPVSR
jgi:predicted transcriptional regulator